MPLGEFTKTKVSAKGKTRDTPHISVANSGRLSEVHDPRGGITTFSYDPAGNRTGLINANGTTVSYNYDNNNRL
jgi:uncharacterized protein RhaS with RHS repeats